MFWIKWKIIPLFLLIVFFSFLFPSKRVNDAKRQDSYSKDTNILGLENKNLPPLPKIQAPPFLKSDTSPLPSISAQYYLVYDRVSRTPLFSLSDRERIAPASLTKLMTAVVVLKKLKIDEVVTVSKPVINGSNMGLVEQEKITVENLLWGLLLPSGNDAAYALSQYYELKTSSSLIKTMNEEAKGLDLNATNFSNPAGLDEKEHYSTAFDLGRLTDYALRFPLIASIVQTQQTTVTSTDGKIVHALFNTNDLLGKINGVIGVKTGTTQNSGQSIILDVFRNGHEVIFVLVKSVNRDQDATSLINWVFTNYQW